MTPSTMPTVSRRRMLNTLPSRIVVTRRQARRSPPPPSSKESLLQGLEKLRVLALGKGYTRRDCLYYLGPSPNRPGQPKIVPASALRRMARLGEVPAITRRGGEALYKLEKPVVLDC